MVSPRHLGALLAEAGLSFQRTRTWKASPDPDYEEKAARILELCDEPPLDGPVISFDQMGPVSLRPTAGQRAGRRKKRPERQRADYNRRARHPLRLRRLRRPRRPAPGQAATQSAPAATCSASCARSALAYPARRRIYWIQDNLSANWVPDDPQLRRRPTRSSSSRPRPTPATSTPSNATSPPSASSSSQTPTTSTGTPSATRSPTTSRYRNGDHRDQRIAAAETKTPHRRLMPLRVQPFLKGH